MLLVDGDECVWVHSGLRCCVLLSYPEGVTVFEGFDSGDNHSFRGCHVVGSAGSYLCGEVEHNARAPSRIQLC